MKSDRSSPRSRQSADWGLHRSRTLLGWGARALAFVALSATTATSTHAYIQSPSVIVLPEAPTSTHPVRLLVGFITDGFLNEASVSEPEPGRFLVEIETTAPCLLGAPCPFHYEKIDVPLGLLDTGAYSVDVEYEDEVVVSTSFVVGPGEDDSPQLALAPTPATIEDFVTATLALRVEDCGMPLPHLVDVSTSTMAEGTVIDIHLERILSGVPCEIGPTRLASLGVPLGSLPSGSVDVRVVLHTVAAPGVPAAEAGEEQVLVTQQIQVLDGDARTLLADRFEVSASFWEADAQAINAANPVALQRAATRPADSALFSFYDSENWELLVKVLDGCSINGHFWVFAAAATDVGWQVEVVDRHTSEAYAVRQEFQSRQPPVTDIEALPCP